MIHRLKFSPINIFSTYVYQFVPLRHFYFDLHSKAYIRPGYVRKYKGRRKKLPSIDIGKHLERRLEMVKKQSDEPSKSFQLLDETLLKKLNSYDYPPLLTFVQQINELCEKSNNEAHCLKTNKENQDFKKIFHDLMIKYSKIKKVESYHLISTEKFEKVMERSGFVVPSKSSAHVIGAFFDYGPAWTGIKKRLIELWRKEFVQSEQMWEVEPSSILADNIVQSSEYKEKYKEFMISEKSKNPKQYILIDLIYDHLENVLTETTDKQERLNCVNLLNQIENLSLEELSSVVNKYNIRAPLTNQALGHPTEETRMLKVKLGRSLNITGFLQPELSLGLLLQAYNCWLLNTNSLPVRVACVGKCFTNHLLEKNEHITESRENTLLQAVELNDPKVVVSHPFNRLTKKWHHILIYTNKHQDENLFPEIMSLPNALRSKQIKNERLIYFINKSYSFFMALNIDKMKIRLKEEKLESNLLQKWILQCKTMSGWANCVTFTEKNCQDLKKQASILKKDLLPSRFFSEIVKFEWRKVRLEESHILKWIHNDYKHISNHLRALSPDQVKRMQDSLQLDGFFDLEMDKMLYDIKPEMVDFKWKEHRGDYGRPVPYIELLPKKSIIQSEYKDAADKIIFELMSLTQEERVKLLEKMKTYKHYQIQTSRINLGGMGNSTFRLTPDMVDFEKHIKSKQSPEKLLCVRPNVIEITRIHLDDSPKIFSAIEEASDEQIIVFLKNFIKHGEHRLIMNDINLTITAEMLHIIHYKWPEEAEEFIEVIPNSIAICDKLEEHANSLNESIRNQTKYEHDDLYYRLNEFGKTTYRTAENLLFPLYKDMCFYFWKSEQTNEESFVPVAIEQVFCVENIILSILEHNFVQRKTRPIKEIVDVLVGRNGGDREMIDYDNPKPTSPELFYMNLPSFLAPFICALFVSHEDRSNEQLVKLVLKTLNELIEEGLPVKIDCSYSSITEKQQLFDEFGVPFSIVFEYQTLLSLPYYVSLRERNSRQQVNIPLHELTSIITSLQNGKMYWSDILLKYPVIKLPTDECLHVEFPQDTYEYTKFFS